VRTAKLHVSHLVVCMRQARPRALASGAILKKQQRASARGATVASFISASTVRAREKSSIITNRKSTMRFPSIHRWTLCVIRKSPKCQRVAQNKIFFYILRCLSYPRCMVIVDTSNFVWSLIIASPNLRTTKLSLEEAWSLARELFGKISNNISKTVQNSQFL